MLFNRTVSYSSQANLAGWVFLQGLIPERKLPLIDDEMYLYLSPKMRVRVSISFWVPENWPVVGNWLMTEGLIPVLKVTRGIYTIDIISTNIFVFPSKTAFFQIYLFSVSFRQQQFL